MTICALATAPGGALGIIRISGPKALEILSRVFTKNLTEADGNTIHYGHIKDGEVVVDEVLVSVFRAPHSYTGEESAEISCHGSRYILNKVLALVRLDLANSPSEPISTARWIFRKQRL